MTGYDFDKTIYDGNSFIDFYLFCLKRHKWIVQSIVKGISERHNKKHQIT